MRGFIVFFLVILPVQLVAQGYNDTLYYRSGMVRPCEIVNFDSNNLEYTYTTQKGDTIAQVIKSKTLDHFVVYDSLGNLVFSSLNGLPARVIERTMPDSMEVSTFIFSVNPLSLGVLGLNTVTTWRFGENLQYGIHVPIRISSPFLYDGNMFFYTGVGFTAFLINNIRYSMTVGITPSAYLVSDDGFLALPVTIGFVRYFTPLLAMDGQIGLGPSIYQGEVRPMPMAHLGVSFLLGQKVRIACSKGYK